MDSPQAARIVTEGAQVTHSTGSAYWAKNDFEGLPYVVKNPLQLPMDSREGSLVSVIPKIRISSLRSGRLQLDFLVNCL